MKSCFLSLKGETNFQNGVSNLTLDILLSEIPNSYQQKAPLINNI